MNILVVDDHPLVRKGIIDILLMRKLEYNISEADNMKEAFKILRLNQIEIMIVDIHLGKENGLDLISDVKKLFKQMKIIVLSCSCNLAEIKRAQALEVDAYILKEAYIEDILYALNVVQRGQKYYSPQLSQYSLEGPDSKELTILTEREKEVLSKLSLGLSNSQISDALYISEGTTKKHISSILSKLNMNNRIEAILYARELYGN